MHGKCTCTIDRPGIGRCWDVVTHDDCPLHGKMKKHPLKTKLFTRR